MEKGVANLNRVAMAAGNHCARAALKKQVADRHIDAVSPARCDKVRPLLKTGPVEFVCLSNVSIARRLFRLRLCLPAQPPSLATGRLRTLKKTEIPL